ncbi:patatin-like phospholipase family protein [Anaerofustis stercorihominis]|uniref:patatin-like phospholipase family protein n=1 Tax=Anaerofustis stercorihominis TaxID=214853 RepID=UPI001106F9FD|nr:patatin family protein [Anaerofustis stercorihominis]
MKSTLHNNKVFSGIDSLPNAKASNKVTKGCIVLEGGAFRGLYGEGVLDALMLSDINLSCTIGVSAGALNGMHYVSGQIGRAARVNLKYRHDRRYIGSNALKNDHGLVGFDFVFYKCVDAGAFDYERFYNSERRFVAVAANCNSGKTVYFEKNKSDIFQAIRASASMPCASSKVWIDGEPYMDGGCTTSIPYQWALDEGYEKIIVVRTRPDDFRKEKDSVIENCLCKMLYRKYPKFLDVLKIRNISYNKECDEIEKLKKNKRIFVISPKKSLDVHRLEPDMEKLGHWYYQGYNETMEQLEKIKEYLEI